jgi:hypothetical protein
LLDALRRASPEIRRSIVLLGSFRSSGRDFEEMLRRWDSTEKLLKVSEHLASQAEWPAYDCLAMIAAGEMWDPDLPENGDRGEIRMILRHVWWEAL